MHYSKIKHFDPANGPGIRISLFVSGCKFHCHNCFNPETWDYQHGFKYTKETEKEIIDNLSTPFYDGLSLLGGDPLFQLYPDIQRYLIPLVQQTKALNKSVWIWSGFTWEEIFNPQYKDYIGKENTYAYRQELIKLCDVWVDGRYEDGKRDLRLPYCGSTNQRVIDVQATLQNPSKEVILWSPN